MKKSMRVILFVLCFLMMISGCKGRKKEETDKVPSIAGKTFYNTVDTFGNEDHSWLWLGKDGSFVLKDNFPEGSYEISGNWSLNEDVLTLDVSKTQAGSFTTVKFEVKDEETVILRTNLLGSGSEDIFSTTEIKGSTVAPVIKDDVIILTYIDANQETKNRSQVELRSDGTFTLKDQNDFGIMEVSGTFEETDTQVILKDLVPGDAFSVKKIEFSIYNNDTLILLTALGNAQEYDIFSRDGKIPEDLMSSTGAVPGKSGSKWQHRKNDMVDNELYLPTVDFDASGSFTLTENVFSGMAKFKGWYEETDTGYICHVKDASQLQGFNCGDGPCDAIKTIEFAKDNEITMVLMTDLCLSRKFDVFDIVKE